MKTKDSLHCLTLKNTRAGAAFSLSASAMRAAIMRITQEAESVALAKN